MLFVDSSDFIFFFCVFFQPIYAEVGDPNYNLLMSRSCSYKTYQELQSAHTNLETNECSKNTAPVATDITSKEYVQMRPYVIC